eukprot:jgi/Tetstr1/455616/TSEL_042428.t1
MQDSRATAATEDNDGEDCADAGRVVIVYEYPERRVFDLAEHELSPNVVDGILAALEDKRLEVGLAAATKARFKKREREKAPDTAALRKIKDKTACEQSERERRAAEARDNRFSYDLQDGFYALGIAPSYQDYLFIVNILGDALYPLCGLPMKWSLSTYYFVTFTMTFVRHERSL